MLAERACVCLKVHTRSVVGFMIDSEVGESATLRLSSRTGAFADWVVSLPGPVAVAHEASPTGFGLARALAAAGVRCELVAPSKMERPPSLAVFAVPFLAVIAAAALIGWLAARRIPGLTGGGGHAVRPQDGPAPLIADDALHAEAPSTRRTVRVLAVGLVLWSTPIALVALLTGAASVYTTQGLFFARTALVTFGGAYAVLAFVAQQAVQAYGWLTAADMVRGLVSPRPPPVR